MNQTRMTKRNRAMGTNYLPLYIIIIAAIRTNLYITVDGIGRR